MFELVFAYLFSATMKVAYAPFKLLPIKRNKVVFLSRQSTEVSTDAAMVIDEITKQDPNVEVVTLAHRDNGGARGTLSMMGPYLKSLYHIATAKVCVLESYWPPVSLCDHRPDLKVVQMWHSIGKVKQSGRIAAGRPGGRASRVAQVMKMHEGNDFIIAGGSAWNQFYCDSFACEPEVLRNVGLPRIDRLIHQKEDIAATIYKQYPQLKGKRVVLYAPTFRRGSSDVANGLLAELARLPKDDYAIVVKPHPNQAIKTEEYAVETCPDIKAIDLLCVTDTLITDYSAIAVEAAAARVNTLYYVPDYQAYKAETGLNIDLYKEMPACVFESAQEVYAALQTPYPSETLDAYCTKFLFPHIGHSTEAIANIIFDEAGLDDEGRCGSRSLVQAAESSSGDSANTSSNPEER